jgi:hypothetical protein
MEDVFDVLVEDHEEIRQALAELEKGPTAATGATEDQLMLRKIMTEELIIEEARHEEIELTCVWPAGVRAAAQRVHPGRQGAFRLRGTAGVAAAAFGADRQGSGRARPQGPGGQGGRAEGGSGYNVNLQPAFSYLSGS